MNLQDLLQPHRRPRRQSVWLPGDEGLTAERLSNLYSAILLSVLAIPASMVALVIVFSGRGPLIWLLVIPSSAVVTGWAWLGVYFSRRARW